MTDKKQDPKPNRITMRANPKPNRPKPQWTDAEREELREELNKVKAFFNSEEYTAIRKTFPLLTGNIEELSPLDVKQIASFLDEVDQAALQSIKNPELYQEEHTRGGQSFIDGLMGRIFFNEEGSTILSGLFKAARDKAVKDIISRGGKQLKNVVYLKDNVSQQLFALDYETNPGKDKFNLPIKTGHKGRKPRKAVNLLCVVDFGSFGSNVTLSRQPTNFDKRVYSVISSFSNNGARIVSVSQIYRAMGGTSVLPSKADREKIFNSLTRMRLTGLEIDNKEETGTFNYPHFKYQGTLLPTEILRNCSITINGKAIEEPIHLLREPPLFSFAKGRGMDRYLPAGVYEVPLNKTEESLQLQDYLTGRILNAKARKRGAEYQEPRILINTLFNDLGIPLESEYRKTRTRLLDKVLTCLEHYKRIGFITDYTPKDLKGARHIDLILNNEIEAKS